MRGAWPDATLNTIYELTAIEMEILNSFSSLTIIKGKYSCGAPSGPDSRMKTTYYEYE